MRSIIIGNQEGSERFHQDSAQNLKSLTKFQRLQPQLTTAMLLNLSQNSLLAFAPMIE